MSKSDNSYSRGQLADLSGVKAETIRYYETIKLLPTPERQANNHRIYKEIHRDRLRFIRRARELGFTLTQVRSLLYLVEGKARNCAEVKQVTNAHLRDTYNKIKDLQKMAAVLADLMQQCDESRSPHCAIVERLFAESSHQ